MFVANILRLAKSLVLLLQLTTFQYVTCFYSPPSTSTSPSQKTSSQKASVRDGDTVLIFGGTGGVGQLVTRRLLEQTQTLYPKLKLRIVSRDIQRASETLRLFTNHDDEDNVAHALLGNQIDFVPIDTLTPTNPQEIQRIEEQLKQAMDNVSAIVISVGTTAFPTSKWKNGNTPQAIDSDAISRIVQIANKISSEYTTAKSNTSSSPFVWPWESSSPTRTNPMKQYLKRIVLITSIGVQRTNIMPFVFLNLFGVLDAKRSGEDAIIQGALTSQEEKKQDKRDIGWDYVIIRPGRLVGGPYTNLDLAKLIQVDGGSNFGAQIQKGDTLLGDCKRITCADAVVQSLLNDKINNIDFSIISAPGNPWTKDQWNIALDKL